MTDAKSGPRDAAVGRKNSDLSSCVTRCPAEASEDEREPDE